jgi:hypothetical protein
MLRSSVRFGSRLALASWSLLIVACSGGDTPVAPQARPVPPPVAAPVLPGILSIAVSGLPAGANADITVNGPSNFGRTATGTASWADAPAGRHTVTIRNVRTADGVFAASPATMEVTVVSGPTPTVVTIVYAPLPSAIEVTVAGVPTGAEPSVNVTLPSGGDRTLSSSGVITSATGGRWRVNALSLSAERAGGYRYAPTPSTIDTVAVPGDTTRVTVRYAVASGAMAIAVTGLPTGVNGIVQVRGPAGFSRTVTSTSTLIDLDPGVYQVISAPVTNNGVNFTPFRDSTSVTVTASLVAAPAPVTYTAQVGRVAITVSGLPADAVPSLTLTGAFAGGSATRTLSGSTTLDSLPVGNYTLAAVPLTVSGVRYVPSPASQVVRVSTGDLAAASVTWSVVPTVVDVTVSGLPNGTNASATLTAPSGETAAITTSLRLSPATAGRWRLAAQSVSGGGAIYVPVRVSIDTSVAAGDTLRMPLQYALNSGALALQLSGLPGGASGNVTVTGPGGFTRSVTATSTITGLTPGSYTVTAGTVVSSGESYAPAPTSQQVVVAASLVATPATVTYTRVVTTGALAVVVNGLPNGVSANITVTGPQSFARVVTSASTLTALVPGSYTISATTVANAGTNYVPAPPSQIITVPASLVPSSATVTYGAVVTTGSVAIAATGLPGGAIPVFTLTSGGTTRTLNGAGTVTALSAGTWTVSAGTVSSGGNSYTPTPSSQSTTVTANSTSSVSFVYALVITTPPGGGTNYTIPNVYLTQAIQRLDGTVTLAAGRDALLRVFVRANAANSARPDVRVRVYDGASLLQTSTIPAPEASVRTVIDEGTLGSTWNVTIAGANIRTALRVLVDLDPAQAVTDANRSDNTWPTGGSPQPISVASVPTFNVRFVPIVVGALTGNVSSANKASFLSSVSRMFPLNAISSDVRAPFTSSATEIQSNDGNGQWLTVLSEINALRTTDGAPSTMHYYGVLKVSYTSGIAGYGYVPGRAAIGWDHLPSGDRVAAHEWGHNFSRDHAPCGTTGDANYPYSGGVINNWGWNSLSNTLVPPTWTDVMGYCGNQWISDYNWSAVMQYRSASGGVSSPSAPGEGLLVWGRVVNGRILLEPAFRVNAPTSVGATSASHRLELLDADGTSLLDTPIHAEKVDHATTADERQFAVVVPWSATLETRLASIRVRDARSPLAAVARTSARMVVPSPGGTPSTPALQAQVDRSTDGRARVTWNSSAYPMAMVRDASTGALMGFVRRSGDAVVTGGRAVDVVYSDGVRSVRR